VIGSAVGIRVADARGNAEPFEEAVDVEDRLEAGAPRLGIARAFLRVEGVVEGPDVAPILLVLVVLLLEAVLQQMRILGSQRYAPPFAFVDVAVVVAEVARYTGVVHDLDHGVEAQAHRSLAVVQGDLVGRGAQRRQPGRRKNLINHGVAHAGRVFVVVGEREFLEAEEALVVDLGVVILELVEVELEGQAHVAHDIWAERARALVAHADMFPLPALEGDGRRHPHRRPVSDKLFPAGLDSHGSGKLLCGRDRRRISSPLLGLLREQLHKELFALFLGQIGACFQHRLANIERWSVNVLHVRLHGCPVARRDGDRQCVDGVDGKDDVVVGVDLVAVSLIRPAHRVLLVLLWRSGCFTGDCDGCARRARRIRGRYGDAGGQTGRQADQT